MKVLTLPNFFLFLLDISKKPEPKLLLQGIHDVYIQQLEILLEPDVSVFISNQNVTGKLLHNNSNNIGS